MVSSFVRDGLQAVLEYGFLIQQRCESLLQAQTIEHEAAIRDAEGRTKRVEKELRQQIERLYEDAKHNEHMFREVNREL